MLYKLCTEPDLVLTLVRGRQLHDFVSALGCSTLDHSNYSRVDHLLENQVEGDVVPVVPDQFFVDQPLVASVQGRRAYVELNTQALD